MTVEAVRPRATHHTARQARHEPPLFAADQP